MEKSFRETLAKQLKNPEFKTEWDALEPEYQLVKEMLEAREENNLSQKNLADLSGITQADISHVESASANPSFKTLKRLAAAMGKDVQIKFVSRKPKDLKAVR